MRALLGARGFEPALAARVVATLVTEKLLDDRRFVGDFIAYRAGRGQGPLRVRADLRRSGVEEELIDAGVAAFAAWPQALEAARRKKFGAARPQAYPERMRQARFLSYRGFTSAQIRSVLGSGVDNED
ncbi:MAG TPA: regulatory protein RecX [Steroidobacteraceae bacterium]|nr:regulatory protein RecX [Steroidobacteraceae bacterium]